MFIFIDTGNVGLVWCQALRFTNKIFYSEAFQCTVCVGFSLYTCRVLQSYSNIIPSQTNLLTEYAPLPQVNNSRVYNETFTPEYTMKPTLQSLQ